MRAITFPFKTTKDEAAFRLLLTMLPSAEDRDTMIEIHNRRDPATGYLQDADAKTNERLVAKIVYGEVPANIDRDL